MELFGENDLHVAQSYDNIGQLHLVKNKYDPYSFVFSCWSVIDWTWFRVEESINSFKTALEIRAKVVGQDHPLMATSLTNLAKVDIEEKRLVLLEILFSSDIES